MSPMTITEFLLARIAEDEADARAASPSPWTFGDVASVAGGMLYDATRTIAGVYYEQTKDHDGSIIRHLRSDEADANGAHIARHDPDRVLAECEAKRRIVEFHQSWPVLVTTPPSFDRVEPDDLSSMTFRASQQIAWATEQEYRAKFGGEPPTAPMLLALAAVYADHPDFDESWRI